MGGSNVERTRQGIAPYLAAAGSAVIFGFSFLFTKNALDNLEAFELLGLRFFLAAVSVLLLHRLRLIQVMLTWDKLRSLLLVALLQPLLYFICETIGVQHTSSSVAGVLIGLIPVAVAAFSALLLKEPVSRKQWTAIIVSAAGVVLLTWPQLQEGLGGLGGVFALLGAVLAGALYNTVSRQASQKAEPAEVTYVMMLVGAVVFNLIVMTRAALNGAPIMYFRVFASSETTFALLYLGLLSSVGAFFLLNYALSRLSASRAAVFINLTPVFSVAAGVLFRGERLLPLQLMGAAVVLAGVWGVTSEKSRRNGG